jgi:hypothetical protein
MKRIWNILLTTLMVILLAVIISWKPITVATPTTGLTQEARLELEHALGH